MGPRGQRSLRRVAHVLALAWPLAGCGDEVVGYFEGSGDGESTLGADTQPASSDGSSESTSGGPTGLVPPGCLADAFDDAEVDPLLWNTWAEEDATFVEQDGKLQFKPPSFGVWDTGVVSSYLATFPFENGRARVRVPAPPAVDRSVVLFLQITEAHAILSIQISQGSVHVYGSVDEEIVYSEDFPGDPYPAWIAIRAEGALVHYETSSDGVSFTTLTTRDKLGPFDVASALLMAQTYGMDNDPARSVIAVDDFEVCVQ